MFLFKPCHIFKKQLNLPTSSKYSLTLIATDNCQKSPKN